MATRRRHGRESVPGKARAGAEQPGIPLQHSCIAPLNGDIAHDAGGEPDEQLRHRSAEQLGRAVVAASLVARAGPFWPGSRYGERAPELRRLGARHVAVLEVEAMVSQETTVLVPGAARRTLSPGLRPEPRRQAASCSRRPAALHLGAALLPRAPA